MSNMFLPSLITPFRDSFKVNRVDCADRDGGISGFPLKNVPQKINPAPVPIN